MTGDVVFKDFDRAIADLEARVAALAAAVVRAGADEVSQEVEHRFGDDAEIATQVDANGGRIVISGHGPATREFGSLARSAQPWVDDTVRNGIGRLTTRGIS